VLGRVQAHHHGAGRAARSDSRSSLRVRGVAAHSQSLAAAAAPWPPAAWPLPPASGTAGHYPAPDALGCEPEPRTAQTVQASQPTKAARRTATAVPGQRAAHPWPGHHGPPPRGCALHIWHRWAAPPGQPARHLARPGNGQPSDVAGYEAAPYFTDEPLSPGRPLHVASPGTDFCALALPCSGSPDRPGRSLRQPSGPAPSRLTRQPGHCLVNLPSRFWPTVLSGDSGPP